MSLSLRIPILWTSFLKVDFGRDFVNKSAILSLERICWTLISPFFWRSCVKNNFGEICFVLSPFMNPPFNWAIHDALSSYKVVGSLSHFKPHLSWIWCIIDLNHTHSRLASWIANYLGMIRWSSHNWLLSRSPRYGGFPTGKHITRLRSSLVWVGQISSINITNKIRAAILAIK